MIVTTTHYTTPAWPVETYPARGSNRITEQYYNMLVGEINRGTVRRAVCRVENHTFDTVSYYLISQP